MYEQQIRDFEHLSFTPVVMLQTGGLGREAQAACKHLASLLAAKRDSPYSTTIGWLHCALSFALLHLSILCIRGTMPAITFSVTQSAFAPTSDRLLCFPGACVGLIGPHPSDYAHTLSACCYFLQAVFLPALGLWSSLPARRVSQDTSYPFLTFSVFF